VFVSWVAARGAPVAAGGALVVGMMARRAAVVGAVRCVAASLVASGVAL
jgi:hypothetical protein